MNFEPQKLMFVSFSTKKSKKRGTKVELRWVGPLEGKSRPERTTSGFIVNIESPNRAWRGISESFVRFDLVNPLRTQHRILIEVRTQKISVVPGVDWIRLSSGVGQVTPLVHCSELALSTP